MKSLTLCLLLLISSSAFATTTFDFKPEVGKVEFKTKGWPNLVTIKGKGNGATGTLTETDGKVSGTLTFDLTSLNTGIDLRDDHMKNKYLQVNEHPTAKLTLTDVSVPKGLDGDFKFTGTLELHGQKKAVSGKAELDKDDNQIEIEAEIPIKLGDFNIDIPSYKGITVAEKVTIQFESKVQSAKK